MFAFLGALASIIWASFTLVVLAAILAAIAAVLLWSMMTAAEVCSGVLSGEGIDWQRLHALQLMNHVGVATGEYASLVSRKLVAATTPYAVWCSDASCFLYHKMMGEDLPPSVCMAT